METILAILSASVVVLGLFVLYLFRIVQVIKYQLAENFRMIIDDEYKKKETEAFKNHLIKRRSKTEGLFGFK